MNTLKKLAKYALWLIICYILVSVLSYAFIAKSYKKLDNYVTDKIDNKYYVYLGAYYNLETARKMQKKYKEEGIHTYIKNDFFSDNNLVSEIKELDNSLLNEIDNKKIFEINEKILKLLKNGIS